MDNIAGVESWIMGSSFLVIVAMMILTRRRTVNLQNRVQNLEQRLGEQSDLFHATATAMKGMEQNLKRLKSELNQACSRLQRAEQATPEQTASPVYRQAINLAMQGRDARELSERFGLSRGEADLLVSFHQVDDRAA